MVAASKTALLIPEILEPIFISIQCPHESDHSSQRLFLPLLRVNKLWQAVAERCLYHTISIRGSDAQTRDLLYDTLEGNAELSALVRELRVSNMYHSCNEVTRSDVALLKLCPNIISVEMRGCDDHDLEDYLSTLRDKSLVSLTLSRQELDIPRAQGFCSSAKLLGMMFGWPNFRRLRLYNYPFTYDNDKDEAHAAVCGHCPAFRHLEVFGSLKVPKDAFQIVAAIAPSMEHLVVSVMCISIPDLIVALRVWSKTLRHLHLEPEPFELGEPTYIDSAFEQCSDLEWLRLDSTLLPPSALQHPGAPRLKSLQYLLTSLELEELVGYLQSPTTLPALQILKVAGTWKHGLWGFHVLDEGVVASAAAICASRGVKFTSYLHYSFEDMNPEAAALGLFEWCNADEEDDEDDEDDDHDQGSVYYYESDLSYDSWGEESSVDVDEYESGEYWY